MMHVKKHTMLTAVLFSAMAVLILSIIILSAVPPVSRDALVHHLAVPKLWIKHGGIYEIPDLVFSYYPMNLDLLYSIPLYFGNDIIPKYLHFAFALATSWLIFTYLRHRLDIFFATLGALFFLSTPVVVKLSITAYVDLGLVFFSTAALMYLLKWYENFPRIKHIVMAALFCGLALGTKYNGLIVLLLMFFLLAFIVARLVSDQKPIASRAFLSGILFIVIAGLVYSPWGIRNYIWTGNPLYPLFDNWFNSAASRDMQSLPPIVLRKLIYHENWWETALVPLRIFFEGQDDSHQYFDGKLNPALLVLPVFSFITSAREKNADAIKFEKVVFVAFSILFILLVFFKTNMRIRYIAPAIPWLVILSIFGLKNIFSLIDKWGAGDSKRVVGGISLIAVFLMLSCNAIYIIEQFRIVTPFQYLRANISRDQYIEKFRPEYAAIRYANVTLPYDAKIISLFIGDRGYYSDREMFFDIKLFQSLIRNSGSPEEMRTKLYDLGFTHLLIRFDMFGNWCNDNLNNIEKQMVDRFLTIENSLLFSKNGHGLYEL